MSLSLEKPKVYTLPVSSNNSNQTPKLFNSLCCTIVSRCVLLVSMLILGLCMVNLLYLAYVSYISDFIVPKVQVYDVTLSQFMLSPTNNTLYYNLSANATFRNPYTQVGIQFDKIEANLIYQGQRLGTKAIHDDVFYLSHKKEKSNVNFVLRGEQVLQLINGDERLVYESETNYGGVYNIGLNVRLAMRFKAIWLDDYHEKYEFMCDNLHVSLSPEGKILSAKFGSTNWCSYKKLEDKSFWEDD